MKKRRQRAKNLTRPPKQFSKLQQESVVPPRSKSFQELKRRLIAGNIQQKRKCRTPEEKILSLNKDAFDSLESLFDVKKALQLSDIESYIDYDHDEVSTESSSAKSSDHCITNSFPYSLPHRFNREPNIFFEHHNSPESDFVGRANHLKSLPFHSVQKIDNYLKMADASKISDEEMPLEERQNQENKSPLPTPSETEEEEDGEEDKDESEEEKRTEGEKNDDRKDEGEVEVEDKKYLRVDIDDAGEYEDEGESEDNGEDDPDSIVGELTEIPEESPEDEVSELSSYLDPPMARPKSHDKLPVDSLVDSEVYKEMMDASSRCAAVEKEIAQLQDELRELQQKEDLNENDKGIVEEKRKNLMEKMDQLDSMTTKIQETMGLVDLTDDIFLRAFETFIESQPPEVTDTGKKDADERTKKMVAEWQAWEDKVPEEDRLPRVIVCGYTEDEFPKIVVADSERKPRIGNIPGLGNITEKLAEALDIQEKLATENAKLEGGKYNLEEALIEKDDTVDTLQRTVCDLQTEMRMIVKENSELSRQLATLNQRLSNQLSNSPRSVRKSPRTTSPRPMDESCRCRHCMQKYHSNTVGVSPRENQQRDRNSPRLGGGGSGEILCCNFGSSADQNLPMCCRNPSVIPLSEQVGSTSGRVICPAEMEDKLANYETTTKHLEQELITLDSGVRNLKTELANVQRERQQLDQQRKLLACTGPCAPCPCSPPGQTSQPAIQLYKATSPTAQDPQGIKYHIAAGSIPSCTGVCINAPMGGSNCPLQQLRDLREQYARLQEDYRNKLTEVSCLRTDAEKMKQDTRDAKDAKERAENRLIDLEERLKMFETDRNRSQGSKEQLMEQEQTLIVAKQRYREAQEELEELRSLIQDQANQLEDYRNKYLQAQEQVEEQRRQIELMEMDNARMNENVTLEIGRVKNQFQEKLSELAPLPDILKQTQIKLQESQQMRLIAERNCEELTRELLNCKDRIGAMTSQSEILRTQNAALKGSDLDTLEDRNRELRNENERLKNALARCEEREIENQKRIDDKKHEIAQLSSMLEQLREDSARQVARTKERCEAIRRRMQGEISEMEKQLVQCRATAKAAQKDRDEIRQKMQAQINHLSESFNHAQSRIRNLQGHVNYLKPASSNTYCIGGPGDGYPTSMTPETNQNPYESCDCNY